MKKFFAFILPLLVGIVIGILIMGLLSMRASKMYLEVLRINYEHEQEMLAARARRDGALHWELAHRKNVVDVCLPNELRAFENTAAIWDFAFPFATPVLEAIGDIPEKDRAYQINKGFKLARLADTLERAGLRDDATSTWKEAAKLLGHNDVKKARSLVKNLKQSDDELLKSLESPNEVVE
jgi:hypothetical protein